MYRPFSIECEPEWTMRESLASAAPTEAEAPPVWSFLGDLEALAGERTEPDAQFFVESWTLGVEAAMRNLDNRQSRNVQRPADYFGSASTADFLEENAFFAELHSATHGWRTHTTEPRPAAEDVRAYEYEEVPMARGAMSMTRARQVLGVEVFSTRTEIKTAYRHQAACWHPDRMAWQTPEARKQATEQMMLINEAYRLLR